MTQPPRDQAAAVSRAQDQDDELHTHAALPVVTPTGTPACISPFPGPIARHLSAPRPDPGPAAAPLRPRRGPG
jgi:hypothetical protein